MEHPDHPKFHICPRRGGWCSDPDGLIFYRGVWHIFHQYMPPPASKWDWAMGWGHVISLDKIHFYELPPIMAPTPGGLDQSGCFSGCAVVDEATGVPYLLYTGARLRSNPDCGPLPPPAYDLNLPFIESQLALTPADPEDPFLRVWCKRDVPIIALPPPDSKFGGWRDPFMLSTPSTSADGKYTMLIGSGIYDMGGIALIYKSDHLLHGWELTGSLCQGHGGIGYGTGLVWETSIIAGLAPTPPTQPAGGREEAWASAVGAGLSPSFRALREGLASLLQQQQPVQHGKRARRRRGHAQRGVAAHGAQDEGEGLDLDLLRARLAEARLDGGGRLSRTPGESAPDVGPEGQQQQQQKHGKEQQLRLRLRLPGGLDIEPSLPGAIRHRSHFPTAPLPMAGAVGHRVRSATAASPTCFTPLAPPASPTSPLSPTSSHDAAATESPASSDASDLTVASSSSSSTTSTASISADGSPPPLPLPERRFFFSVSPDACTNPTLYWLGSCPQPETFDIDDALGPFRLDLGDILYAPNLIKDDEGRVILLAWMRERRKVGGEYTYAGCLCAPRALSLDATDPQVPRLVQQPLPELANLRVAAGSCGGRRAGGSGCGASSCTCRMGSNQNGLGSMERRQGGKSACLLRQGGGCWPVMPGAPHEALAEDGSGEGDDGMSDSSEGSSSLASVLNGEEGRLPQPRWAAALLRRQGRSGAVADDAAPCYFDGDNLGPDSGADAWVTAAVRPAAAAECLAAVDAAVPGLDLGLHVGKDRPLRVPAGGSVEVPGINGSFMHVDIEVHFAPGGEEEAAQVLGAVAGRQQAPHMGDDISPHMERPPKDLPGGAANGGAGAEAIGPEGEAHGGLMSGLVLRSWDAAQGGSAALLYCWRTSTLEVVFEAVDPETHQFSLSAPDVRRVGGRLQRPPAPGEALRLRLLLDASLLEVFTADGEVLSTRVYRGAPLPSCPVQGAECEERDQGGGGTCGPGGCGDAAAGGNTCGVEVISVGGTTLVPHLAAWEMESCYVEEGSWRGCAGRPPK